MHKFEACHNASPEKNQIVTYRFNRRSCIEFDPSAFLLSILSMTFPLTRDSASCDLDLMCARLPGDGARLSPSWLVTLMTGIASSRFAIEKPLSSILTPNSEAHVVEICYDESTFSGWNGVQAEFLSRFDMGHAGPLSCQTLAVRLEQRKEYPQGLSVP